MIVNGIDCGDIATKSRRTLALERACQAILDFYHLDTLRFVARYGHDVSTRTIGNWAREALAMPETTGDGNALPDGART